MSTLSFALIAGVLALATSARADSSRVVRITVQVPESAVILVNGSVTKQTGSIRVFLTPPLDSGVYHYTFQAIYNDGGIHIELTKKVEVSSALSDVEVNFISPNSPLPRPESYGGSGGPAPTHRYPTYEQPSAPPTSAPVEWTSPTELHTSSGYSGG